MGMERSDDVRRNIEKHLQSKWGRIFLCTKQQVRESIMGSLLGIRTTLQSGKDLTNVDLHHLRTRCKNVHEQLDVLMERGDQCHGKILRRILQSFERKLGAISRENHSSDE